MCCFMACREFLSGHRITIEKGPWTGADTGPTGVSGEADSGDATLTGSSGFVTAGWVLELETASARFVKSVVCSNGEDRGAGPISGVGRAEDVTDNEAESVVSELLLDESEFRAARGGACG